MSLQGNLPPDDFLPPSSAATPASMSQANNSDDASTGTKKSKSARRSVACKSCHSLKVKCTPADPTNPSGSCIRCLNANRKCEIDLNQTRKRRKKADILLANLRDRSEAPTVESSVAPSTPIIASVLEAPSPAPTTSEEVIENLKRQVKSLEAQLQQQQAFNQHAMHHSRNINTSNDTISDVDSPPFISKSDLEREILFLCDSSVTKLTDLTNDLKTVADRRTLLFRDSRPVDVVSTGLLSLEEATERLETYRKVLFVQHPLIEIPNEISIQELREKLPFLFNAVMSVTSVVYNKQLDIDKALNIDNAAVQSIAVEVMVSGTKSDELVKSLILLCVWYNSPELFRQRRYHLLNTLGVTMLHDLGIVARPSYSFKGEDRAVTQDDNKKQNSEYQSLVLIVYFTTVSICLILKRTIYVKWTPFVEECCSTLERSPNRTWRELALFSRLSHLLDKIHHIIHSPEISESRRSTPHYIIHEMQKALSIVRHKIRDDDHAFLAYYFSVEAYLHEPCLTNVFTNDENGDNMKLTESSAKSISNCTNSCLNALDEFNKLSLEEVAGIPLFYSSRIIYTAGMLLRLRYLILSLPSHIEKDLVPYHAIFAIQRANKILDQASIAHSANHFLKKTRLVLQLFIQTYATQVQELLRKNGETPQNLKPTPKKELHEMDRLSNIFRAHHQAGQKSIINDDANQYDSNVPLDILSYAASYRRDSKDSNMRGRSSPSAHATNGLEDSKAKLNTPQSYAPTPSALPLTSSASVGAISIPPLRASETLQPSNLSHLHRSSSLGIINNSSLPIPSNGHALPPMFGTNGNPNAGMTPPLLSSVVAPSTKHQNQLHQQTSLLQLGQLPSQFRQPSIGLNKQAYNNLANPDQLENSYMALNDEFWSDLLSTESDRINFSNNNYNSAQVNDELFFMN